MSFIVLSFVLRKQILIFKFLNMISVVDKLWAESFSKLNILNIDSKPLRLVHERGEA